MAITIPRPLNQGDKIAIVAPASFIRNPEHFRRGISVIENHGYQAVFDPGITGQHGLFSAPDKARARELETYFSDPEIGAILCARAGYGSARLLRHLDLDIVKANPKFFIGFSDVTILLNLFSQATDLATLHGPMVTSPSLLTDQGQETLLWDILEGNLHHTYSGLTALSGCQEPVSAPLTGGCLSILLSTLGTPYEIDLKGKILFLEDIFEPAYRLDRLLCQLEDSGKLDSVAGIVLGQFLCDTDKGFELQLQKIFQEHFSSVPCPVLYGLPSGHGRPNVPLIIGATYTLSPENGTIRY